MGLDNLQTDSSKWTKGDTQRSRLRREVQKKGFTDVVVTDAEQNDIDGPFYLQVSGEIYSGEYEELRRCIAQASESDTDSLKALLRNAEENEEGEVIRKCDEPLSQHFGSGSAKWQQHNIPEEHIAVAAYFIWKEEGCPDGRDLVHWGMAIENLKRARAGVPVRESTPKAISNPEAKTAIGILNLVSK